MDELDLNLKQASNELIESNKSLKAAVFHWNQPIRTSIINALNQLGLMATNISIVTNDYEELNEIIKNKKPEIVICPDHYQQSSDDDLTFKDALEIHESEVPDRLKGSFIILSEDNSKSGSTTKFEYLLDGYLILPITQVGVNNTLVDILQSKFKATKGMKIFNKGRELFIQRDFSAAKEYFTKAVDHKEVEGLAYCFSALVEERFQEFENAIEIYQRGLTLDEGNYLCLSNLVRCLLEQGKFQESYKVNVSFLEKYPINPDHFLRVIKLAVATKNYDDILGLVELVDQAHLYSKKIKKYLAAGLVMGGRFLFENERDDDALKAINSGLKVTENNPVIVKTACKLIAKHYFASDAIKTLEKFANQGMTDSEFCDIQLHIYNDSEDFKNLLKAGQYFLDKSHPANDVEIYFMILKAAKKQDLSKDRIHSIIGTASEIFPDQANFFEEYLK